MYNEGFFLSFLFITCDKQALLFIIDKYLRLIQVYPILQTM